MLLPIHSHGARHNFTKHASIFKVSDCHCVISLNKSAMRHYRHILNDAIEVRIQSASPYYNPSPRNPPTVSHYPANKHPSKLPYKCMTAPYDTHLRSRRDLTTINTTRKGKILGAIFSRSTTYSIVRHTSHNHTHRYLQGMVAVLYL